jgi:2-oxoglutarate dehydrogenase E2 component (dihydrolipoamide succinyltransferase)
MKVELKIPQMGESIQEAIIGKILKPSQSTVRVDDEVVEIETEKLNQVLYAPATGVFHVQVREGDRVKVGQVIGYVEEQAVVQEKKEGIEKALPQKSVEEELHVEEVVVRKEADRREERQKLSQIRKVIAERLVKAKQETAMLTTFNEVDMSNIISFREKNKETFQKKFGVKLGFMSFFVKAVVDALQAYPIVNAYLDRDDLVLRKYYDIGVAVSTARGVIVPVLRDADLLTFADIEKKIDDFIDRSKTGALEVGELQGGGFTITNGGVFGSLLSTPLLNPPQCAILGMHKITKRPVAIDDQVVIRPMMYLALSYDHRILDGKEAVSFLVHVKEVLEDPLKLMMGF